jgi:ADP-ribosylglycohydrolase
MKIAPLGVLSAKKCVKDLFQQVVNISSITHHSKMAAVSGVIHAKVIEDLLWESSDRFNLIDFITHICETKTRQVTEPTEYGQFSIDHLSDTEDDIYSRMELLYTSYMKYHGTVEFTTDWIVENLKGGCYVYESLPFSYAFFMRNPHSIDSLYEVVNAGGDTDSNGSIVGGMLGALHGMKIFPQHLVEGVMGMSDVLRTANRLCDTLDIR